MDVCWLVDELLSERAYETGYPSIADIAKELGHRVYKTKYIPFSTGPDPLIGMFEMFEQGSCVVTHGTVQFCKQIEAFFGRMWTPGMYFNSNVKNWSKFAPYIGEDLLNGDYIILPFAEAKRRHVDQDAMFIKPESGLKEFTGQIVDYKDDFDKLAPHGNGIDPTTLCVVSQPKQIKAEFRYVICEKTVVTGSEYRWDNVLDVRRDTHPLCDVLAQKIASADWQADTVYVCDIALMEGGHLGYKDDHAKVVELNAFSSSGLYACDTYKIVEAVSKAAWNEHNGS